MNTVKAEKEAAMRRYRRIRNIGAEACAALLAVSWYSSRIPAAARISGDFLRSAASAAFGPRFIFLVGNAIIILLFAKSGKLSVNPTDSPPSSATDEILGDGSLFPPSMTASLKDEALEIKACVEVPAVRRSRSAVTARRRREPELRRSESVTVTAEKGEAIEEGEGCVEDAEEFRRTIDAFIAKQLRFQRDEETLAVVSSAGPLEPKMKIMI